MRQEEEYNHSMTETQEQIDRVTSNFSKFLIEKNKRYGNSALKPLDVFGSHISDSNSPALNNMFVRLDDKLSRIKNSDLLRKNDIADLVGYLILMCVSQGWEDFSDLID